MTHTLSRVRFMLNLTFYALLKLGHPFHPGSTVNSASESGKMQLPSHIEHKVKKGEATNFRGICFFHLQGRRGSHAGKLGCRHKEMGLQGHKWKIVASKTGMALCRCPRFFGWLTLLFLRWRQQVSLKH
jgi:hypothetical protein